MLGWAKEACLMAAMVSGGAAGCILQEAQMAAVAGLARAVAADADSEEVGSGWAVVVEVAGLEAVDAGSEEVGSGWVAQGEGPRAQNRSQRCRRCSCTTLL